MATELPVIRAFRKRASRGISREGTLSFLASRDAEDLRNNNDVDGQVIFMSRGADLGVNRRGQ